MELFEIAVLISALLCSLVAGLVFTFAIIVMPGIKNLGDLSYLQSFKAIDRVIQNNQPVFILVWVGSVVVLLGTTLLGIWQLEGLNRILLVATCVVYLSGVHIPTITINIPLNNHLQSQNLETMTAPELLKTKIEFESRWLLWNSIRTILAVLTTALLLVLLIRL